jgi:hypothetical protein
VDLPTFRIDLPYASTYNGLNTRLDGTFAVGKTKEERK